MSLAVRQLKHAQVPRGVPTSGLKPRSCCYAVQWHNKTLVEATDGDEVAAKEGKAAHTGNGQSRQRLTKIVDIYIYVSSALSLE
jgi:hypothetical protein